ncbi:6-bladed beta-propeller [Fontibacter flavus]|uniref:6-bladed beta-propeller n=1 Tax=Fontibacter flavus TaxID=654838 RepID=A0ABV6FPY5_9BACT
MKAVKYLHLYIFLLVCFSCKKPIKESNLIHIEVPLAISPEISVDELAELHEKIHLETTKDVLLSFVKDVKILEDRIYLAELNQISVFDRKGNFIGRIGKQGDGPGEYQKVVSMEVDEITNRIFVTSGYKLLIYSTENELLEERRLPMPLEYITVIDQVPFILSERIGVKVNNSYANQTKLFRLNQSLDVSDSIPVRTIYMEELTIGGFSVKYYISNIEEGLFLFKPVFTPENLLRDTLYRIDTNILTPYLKLDFERPQSLNEQGYQTLLINNLNISSNYILCEYDQDWERMMFLYNKNESKGYNLKGGLIDSQGNVVLLRPLDLNNDLFYYIKNDEFEDKSIEEQNPILGIVKLK